MQYKQCSTDIQLLFSKTQKYLRVSSDSRVSVFLHNIPSNYKPSWLGFYINFFISFNYVYVCVRGSHNCVEVSTEGRRGFLYSDSLVLELQEVANCPACNLCIPINTIQMLWGEHSLWIDNWLMSVSWLNNYNHFWRPCICAIACQVTSQSGSSIVLMSGDQKNEERSSRL